MEQQKANFENGLSDFRWVHLGNRGGGEAYLNVRFLGRWFQRILGTYIWFTEPLIRHSATISVSWIQISHSRHEFMRRLRQGKEDSSPAKQFQAIYLVCIFFWRFNLKILILFPIVVMGQEPEEGGGTSHTTHKSGGSSIITPPSFNKGDCKNESSLATNSISQGKYAANSEKKKWLMFF